MIVCPGCAQPAELGTYPSVSMAWAEDVSDRIPWWCPACLADRIAMIHADSCRCQACVDRRLNEESVA